MQIKTFLTLLFLLIVFSCSNINNSFVQEGQIEFTDYEYDFGSLLVGSIAGCTFNFINISVNPIIIQNVTTSCGCAIPDWTDKPVQPGKKGKISIQYDTSILGSFQKTITVYYNGNDSPKYLKIRGSVYTNEILE